MFIPNQFVNLRNPTEENYSIKKKEGKGLGTLNKVFQDL